MAAPSTQFTRPALCEFVDKLIKFRFLTIKKHLCYYQHTVNTKGDLQAKFQKFTYKASIKPG